MRREASGQAPDRLHPIRLSVPAMVLLLGLAAGCGESDPWDRQAITGVVTLDGHALEEGAILLEPLAGDGSGMAVGATIRRGAFAIAREQGAPPGAYRVRVYSSSGSQPPPGRGQSERTRRAMVDRLPEVYNTRSELRTDIVHGGRNHLLLELHGAGGG